MVGCMKVDEYRNYNYPSKYWPPLSFRCKVEDLFLDLLFFLEGLGHLIRIGIMDEGIERIIFFLGQGFPKPFRFQDVRDACDVIKCIEVNEALK